MVALGALEPQIVMRLFERLVEQLLLRGLDLVDLIAVERALGSGKIESLAAGRMGMGTSEVGDLIAGYAGE